MMLYAPPTLMREFNVPSSTVQWLTTGFMLTNGIMIPVTAFLIETFTTRQLFLYAMGMFFAGSLACALPPPTLRCCSRDASFRPAVPACL